LPPKSTPQLDFSSLIEINTVLAYNTVSFRRFANQAAIWYYSQLRQT
jgi:hypothetical protein